MTPEELRRITQQRALGTVYWKRPALAILPKDRTHFYGHIGEVIGTRQPIDYLEFGVANGNSMKEMILMFAHPYARFWGFDSFVGLPEPWQEMKVGAFNRDGVEPIIASERVKLVKGWFQDTLPEFLRFFHYSQDRPVLVHIDSDLYSSALFILTMLWPHVPEYYFICDEFLYDEVVALGDFINAYPVRLEFLAQTRGGGERANPDQVFGKLTRCRYEDRTIHTK